MNNKILFALKVKRSDWECESPKMIYPHHFGHNFHDKNNLLILNQGKEVGDKLFNIKIIKCRYDAAIRASTHFFLWFPRDIFLIFNGLIINKKIIIGLYQVEYGTHHYIDFVKRVIIKIVMHRAQLYFVMTEQQKKYLSSYYNIPAEKIYIHTFGIDIKYFKKKMDIKNLKVHEPYYLVVGDEARNNDLLILLASKVKKTIVRVCQYPEKSDIYVLQKDIHRYGLEEKLIIEENITYEKLRCYFQNAELYLGIVNNDYQPAGWTVACEAIASGCKILLKEGLVSKELNRLGVVDNTYVVKSWNVDDWLAKIELVENENKINYPEEILEKINIENTSLNLYNWFMSLS